MSGTFEPQVRREIEHARAPPNGICIVTRTNGAVEKTADRGRHANGLRVRQSELYEAHRVLISRYDEVGCEVVDRVPHRLHSASTQGAHGNREVTVDILRLRRNEGGVRQQADFETRIGQSRRQARNAVPIVQQEEQHARTCHANPVSKCTMPHAMVSEHPARSSGRCELANDVSIFPQGSI